MLERTNTCDIGLIKNPSNSQRRFLIKICMIEDVYDTKTKERNQVVTNTLFTAKQVRKMIGGLREAVSFIETVQ